MSIESRYDTLVKDMITLMQQALFRFFTDKEVDLAKFKHYFCQFYKNMSTLQENFHDKSAKFTKNLTKLSELFQKSATTPKFALEPTPSKSMEPSQILSKPKTAHNPVPLKIIGEQQQQLEQRQRQKRSGTAQGKRRPQNFIIDFSQGKYRPKTGVSRENKRYRQLVGPNSQTISHDIQLGHKNYRTFNSKDLDDEAQFKRERKSFYNELEKQQQRTETIYENMVKVPRKKSISTHRWSFKINKLL